MPSVAKHSLSGSNQGLSLRYAQETRWDKFDRNRIFVEEARKYRNVLETGCSSGFLSKLIASGNTRVVGIELDKQCAEMARNHCARVVACDLNDSSWIAEIGERFQLVTFGDVLEHLYDPAAVLEQTRELLVPGGRVLISLPNIAHWTIRAGLLAGTFRYQSVGILDRTHLRFFTLESARELMEKAGYRILWFRPVIGGRFNGKLRWLWQFMANAMPGLFAYQMMFLVEPFESPETGR